MRRWVGLVTILLFAFLACDELEKPQNQARRKRPVQQGDTAKPGRQSRDLELVEYSGGFFTMQIPKGWKLSLGGQCGTWAWVVRDPGQPLNQVFFFSNVGPVYLTAQKKQFDVQYMRAGGYRINWVDMPVVQPFTPAEFLGHWFEITQTQMARGFMNGLPALQNLKVVGTQDTGNLLNAPGAKTQWVRALFQENGQVGEGIFYISTVPQELVGFGFGMFITGITAAKKDFSRLQKSLTRCVESVNLTQDYVNNCLRAQNQQFEAQLKAGKTMSETSDIIMKSWENRNRSQDVISEKWSDTMLGKERLYDPGTGQVYEFGNGFYDRYKLENNKYNLPSLQPLPDNNHQLWTAPTLDGGQHLRREY